MWRKKVKEFYSLVVGRKCPARNSQNSGEIEMDLDALKHRLTDSKQKS